MKEYVALSLKPQLNKFFPIYKTLHNLYYLSLNITIRKYELYSIPQKKGIVF